MSETGIRADQFNLIALGGALMCTGWGRICSSVPHTLPNENVRYS